MIYKMPDEQLLRKLINRQNEAEQIVKYIEEQMERGNNNAY